MCTSDEVFGISLGEDYRTHIASVQDPSACFSAWGEESIRISGWRLGSHGYNVLRIHDDDGNRIKYRKGYFNP